MMSPISAVSPYISLDVTRATYSSSLSLGFFFCVMGWEGVSRENELVARISALL